MTTNTATLKIHLHKGLDTTQGLQEEQKAIHIRPFDLLMGYHYLPFVYQRSRLSHRAPVPILSIGCTKVKMPIKCL
jgi:hypothetical protein